MASHTIALPPERFAQLKLLAETEGVSLSDEIAGFLDAAIEAKRLPDELPGWNIQRLGHNVLLANAASGFAKLMHVDSAKKVAESFHNFGAPEKGRSALLDLDNMIEMRRQGVGVIIRDAESFAECSMAANIASDIGRRLQRAAA